MHKWIVRNSPFLITAMVIISLLAMMSRGGSIQTLGGLAVAGPNSQWINLQDASIGSPIANGLASVHGYLYNGTNFSYAPGDSTNGAKVNVTAFAGTKTPADAFANPTDAIDSWSFNALYNGATWDRYRSAGVGNSAPSTGLPAAVPYTEFLTTLPTATTATYGAAQSDSNFVQFANTSSYKYSNALAVSSNNFTLSGTIKSGAGWLHLLTINQHGTAASTVTLYDNTAASGATIGTIITPTTITTQDGYTLYYDIVFTTGLSLTVSGSTTADMTISYK